MFIPNKKQTFSIPGSAGAIELLISSPVEPRAVTCIVCHPHPVQGGTMHNKVVYTLASAVEALGIKSVRFNFRGVQKSEGAFDHGVGELEDLCTVIHWLKSECPNDAIWLAGFSFGAFIALKGSADLAVQGLITVAPPVGHPYFEAMPDVVCPWVLVQGEKDEVVESSQVLAWAKQQAPMPNLIVMPEAGHFFHGQLILLKDALLQALAAW